VTVLAATGIALWCARDRNARLLGIALVACAVAAGWARVLLGIHYPGDVAGGFAVGALAVAALRTRAGQWLVRSLARALEHLRKAMA
jgi:undecaprenyl-diphosphatase